MKKFGTLKGKMLKKITEAFSNNNKNEVKDILKLLKENKDLKELYILYEDIENKQIEDYEVAKLFVNELSSMLKSKDFSLIFESLEKKLEGVESDENEVYNLLDILSENDTLLNIDKKVITKKKLVEFLMSKKQVYESKNISHTKNENLLLAVLTNNFNISFTDSLNEEEKNELKSILSLTDNELKIKITDIKESINSDISKILNESSVDVELTTKLDDVKKEIDEMSDSKYNYYRLIQLKNGLS
jgi:hypothetical protein